MITSNFLKLWLPTEGGDRACRWIHLSDIRSVTCHAGDYTIMLFSDPHHTLYVDIRLNPNFAALFVP